MSYEEENERINSTIASTIKIKDFTYHNEELKYDQDFEKNCIVLAKLSNKPVKECTVKEYFSLIKFYDKQKKHAS